LLTSLTAHIDGFYLCEDKVIYLVEIGEQANSNLNQIRQETNSN